MHILKTEESVGAFSIQSTSLVGAFSRQSSLFYQAIVNYLDIRFLFYFTVPNEGYVRNALCALNKNIYVFFYKRINAFLIQSKVFVHYQLKYSLCPFKRQSKLFVFSQQSLGAFSIQIKAFLHSQDKAMSCSVRKEKWSLRSFSRQSSFPK